MKQIRHRFDQPMQRFLLRAGKGALRHTLRGMAGEA
jgi:hypothetical protein